MPIYKIAELNFEYNPHYEKTALQLLPYACDESKVDFSLSVTDEEIASYKVCDGVSYSVNEAESTALVNKLYNKIFDEYNGFFFHSSSLMLDNEGYVFTAESGTGKSTHASLWCTHFGNKVTMINDDKPIIRKIDDKFFIFGTPWMGKSNIGNNISTTVKAVYILRQSKENSIKKVSVGEVFPDLLKATLVLSSRDKFAKLLEIYDEFFSTVSLFVLNCNTDISSVKVAYEAAQNSNAKDN